VRCTSYFWRLHSPAVPGLPRSQPFPPFSTGTPRFGGGPGAEEHDFGPVLARGQLLQRRFTFTNSTNRPILLTGGTASTPCCSGIGPIYKETIPPGGQCSIPVALKAVAHERGKKLAEFTVQTDSKECPVLTYALRAAFYPEWEILAAAGSSKTLPIGGAGRQLFRITCTRLAGEGNIPPTQVVIKPPLAARFLGESREQPEPDGVTTIVREVEIALPPYSEPGIHQGTIQFRWPEGRTREHLVVWEVVPPLRVSPSKLIQRKSERGVSHTVVIRSFDDQPFRVIGVEPSYLALSSESTDEAARIHTLTLRIDADRAAEDKDAEIVIRTDRGDQPVISLKIVVLPEGV